MMKRLGLVLLALAVTGILPLTAGEGEHAYKCDKPAQDCLNYLAANMKDRGWAGVEIDNGEHGMKVKAVTPDSPAQRAGIKAGDVFVALNGIRFSEENMEKLGQLEKEALVPGNTVTVTIDRSGKEKDFQVSLEKMPESALARIIGEHMLQHATVASN